MEITPLISFDIPSLSSSQLDRFNQDSIHLQKIQNIDPIHALERLKQQEGARVIGADFGGDKGLTKLFVVRNGNLEIDEAYSDYVQGDHGDGYLASLEKTAAYANEHGIPFAISWGAPLDGTRPLDHPKMQHFLDEIRQRYDGDLAHVIPTMKACLNDGPAGLVSGIIEANRTQPTSTFLFPINGGGLGMAVLKDGVLYATEAGHVESDPEANRYDREGSCGVFGAIYVCIEMLGANKAGIETQWQTRNGSYMRARDIEDQYKAGDAFAGELYDNSAWIVSHMIQGTADALEIDLTDSQTAVVCHGGAFKFPHYGERIAQILGQHNGVAPRLLMTKDYGSSESNACLDGAALAALLV